MIAVRYEGLREVAQALRIIDTELYKTLVAALKEVGDVIQRDARKRFVDYGESSSSSGGWQGLGRAAAYVKAADGLQTLVRPNTSTMALVSVGQTLRRSSDMPRRRSNFGDLMMRHALLPARNEGMAEAAAVLDKAVGGLLHQHGF